jgi:hypothetical protein
MCLSSSETISSGIIGNGICGTCKNEAAAHGGAAA